MNRSNPTRGMHHARQLLLPALLVLLSLGAAAQSGNRFGLKAGVNWSNLRGEGENVSDKDMRTGFHGGVFGRYAPNEHLGFQAELLYSQKGTRVTYDGLFDQEATFKLSYLEVPVFGVVGVGEILELHAGVYAAYLLSSSVSTAGDLGSDEDELDRDNFQGADYGLVLGVAADLGPAQIGLHYVYGMAELAASDDAQFLLGNSRNSAYQLYLAVGLGGK